jgi:hypothetical protein
MSGHTSDNEWEVRVSSSAATESISNVCDVFHEADNGGTRILLHSLIWNRCVAEDVSA